MRNRQQNIACCLGLLLLVANAALVPETLGQQRIRIPQDAGVTSNPLTPVLQGSPSTTLGTPSFDPYSTGPNAASSPPSLLGSPTTAAPSAVGQTPFWNSPTVPQTNFGPTSPAPNIVIPQGASPYGTYQPQPGVLFPNGISSGVANSQAGQYLRLFQDVRISHTWLHGKRSDQEMTINDTEVGTTMNIPNFFFSGQPVRISPVFVFHAWDGPVSHPSLPAPPLPPAPAPPTVAAGMFPTDLPSRVYSTYLDFAWDPVITPQLGADLEASVGIYSDFNAIDKHSLRFRGTGLFVLGLTPTVAVKGGVTYLDRLDVKLLPAGGILWRPNPQTYFDIYFPKPKLAQYLYTVGNTDVWWYFTAEYGGGSWTVDRSQIVDDGVGGFTVASIGGDRRVDINDIRAGLGLEWTHQCGLTGFFEVAYVWDRELVFASGAPAKHKLKDTIMLRGGVTY